MAVNPIYQRLQLLTGTPALRRLNDARVAIFGVGGFVGAASVATILFWPNVSRDSVKVAPQANAGGGGLTLVGSF